MTKHTRGKLIVIGGHEDKDQDETILKTVADLCGDGKPLVIMTVATQYPEEVGKEYTKLFKDLGVSKVEVVHILTREDGFKDSYAEMLQRAGVVFFTGGDQLRITSQIGDSPIYRSLVGMYEAGGCIAGTSAGAAAMPETMIVAGPGDETTTMSALGMAPGLGLLRGAVVDSHFAERGRFGRLLGAVAQNPRNIGLGIDEDTAIIVDANDRFTVIGSGAVYVVDGRGVTYSSLSEETADGIVSIFDVKLHVLAEGDAYDLASNQPVMPEAESAG